jgi:hypothetical protein
MNEKYGIMKVTKKLTAVVIPLIRAILKIIKSTTVSTTAQIAIVWKLKTSILMFVSSFLN